ncbi:MAG TPA: helix-turn-helix transcriptional regulator [Candidatus Dormibacteraeota bacterium]|nr:helix-turn-helix transcriptional regulator [Candidatus Dormibacteraeota bacterium]
MIIGERLRAIRESKNLSQGDLEKRTGLLRCYLSRVECGHTVPSLETMQKWAKALDVPLYQLFTELDEPEGLNLPRAKRPSPKVNRVTRTVSALISKMKERDQVLLVAMARKLARQ